MKIRTPRLIAGTVSIIRVGQDSRENVPRAYAEPLQDADKGAGTRCLYQEWPNVYVDGEREEKAPPGFSE
jgi:hypothetical protein